MNELDDLIKEGVRIRENRLAEAREFERAERERAERKRAEATERVLALLPAPLRQMAQVETPNYVPFAHAIVRINLPKGGQVSVLAVLQNGTWRLATRSDGVEGAFFEAQNPQGYCAKFETIEEAVAFAAGAFDI